MVTRLLFNLSIPFIWQFAQNTDVLNLGHMFIYGDFHNTLEWCKTPIIIKVMQTELLSKRQNRKVMQRDKFKLD